MYLSSTDITEDIGDEWVGFSESLLPFKVNSKGIPAIRIYKVGFALDPSSWLAIMLAFISAILVVYNVYDVLNQIWFWDEKTIKTTIILLLPGLLLWVILLGITILLVYKYHSKYPKKGKWANKIFGYNSNIFMVKFAQFTNKPTSLFSGRLRIPIIELNFYTSDASRVDVSHIVEVAWIYLKARSILSWLHNILLENSVVLFATSFVLCNSVSLKLLQKYIQGSCFLDTQEYIFLYLQEYIIIFLAIIAVVSMVCKQGNIKRRIQRLEKSLVGYNLVFQGDKTISGMELISELNDNLDSTNRFSLVVTLIQIIITGLLAIGVALV